MAPSLEKMENKILGKKDFEKLFNLWFNDLMGFVCSYVRNEEVAQDIVHDAFTTIWNNRKNLDTSRPLKSYLFTLARNYALNYIRHQKVVDRHEDHMIRITQEMQEEFGELDSALERLDAKIAELPEKQREVLTKCFVDGKTYKEAAEELNISLNTVKTHLKRALKYLREELQDNIVLLFMKNV